ncbi:hypothetical protein FHS19_000003 [Paenibacillus rhizosphaerae]|uniref:Uncharacterized protein n=1 Tax=Paenibacillus rhizosphaerae TaxID=297318 RepID=A0A839TJ19_9BACL|nr:hypothetical protein [Paenibacillus rhizosphaerae]MBB3125349.1 hypothetical protein [Paenibacillus rhizosphaerae]
MNLPRNRLMFTIYDWFGYELPIKDRYELIKEAEMLFLSKKS